MQIGSRFLLVKGFPPCQNGKRGRVLLKSLQIVDSRQQLAASGTESQGRLALA